MSTALRNLQLALFPSEGRLTRARCRAAALISLLFAGALLPVHSRAQAVFSTEYDIKAALLFHLTQFTEWPASAFTNSSAPIVIGVLGQNPFGASLDKAVAGEKVNNRKVETRYFHDVNEVKCHVLFISRSESRQIERLIDKLRGRGILTVSDIDRFARRGGMVGFRTDSNRRVVLNINLAEVERAKLKISSKLLRIATLVETER